MKVTSAQKLKELVLDAGLPREDLVFFGAVCPYCGKNDRVRKLELPGGLAGKIDEKDQQAYNQLWAELMNDQGDVASLGVCKFCHNILLVKSEKEVSGIL